MCACSSFCVLHSSFLRQVEDFYRFDLVGGFEAEDVGVEVEFGFVGADDVFGFAESVLFAGEGDVCDGHAALLERFENQLGLVGRHDFVFQTLQEDHGAAEAIEMVDGRALAVTGFILWVRADEPIEVARFEFVRVVGHQARGR